MISSSTPSSLVDEVARRRFEAAWRSGQPSPIENFLPADEDTRYLPTLEELILIELEMSWKSYRQAGGEVGGSSGPPRRIEDYLAHFPRLNRPEVLRRLVEEEYQIRRRFGDNPSLEEYAARFPSVMLDSDGVRTIKEAPPPITAPPPLEVPGFTIVGELGKGGMGIVYKAQQTKLKRLVALKVLLGGASAQSEELVRFRTEAQAIARLKHPNVVQVYEVGEWQPPGSDTPLPYLALEYVEGGSLFHKLREQLPSFAEAARLMQALARGVHAAHERGIIHRDLKPGNVLLTADGTPKVTDFGLAKRLEETDGHTHTGQLMGTPCYMPPEQARGEVRAIGAVSDVYSLGAVFYELLTGRPPFKGAHVMETLVHVMNRDPVPPSQLRPKLPRDLETICLKCLQKDAVRRYPSAAALADDLQRYLVGEPIQARPASYWERGIKWVRRHPAKAMAWVLLGVAVVGYVLYLNKALADQLRSNQLYGQIVGHQNDAKEHLDKNAYDAAEASANQALALLTTAPSPELEEQTRALLKTIQAHRDSRSFQVEFRDRSKHTHLHNAHTAGLNNRNDLVQTREQSAAALALFGPRSNAILQGPHLTDAEKQEILDGRYELSLILANALAQVLPGEDHAQQARAALRVLDEAKPLRPPTQAYYLQKAQYLAQLQDRKGTDEALARSRDPEVRSDSAVDQFLLGNKLYQQDDWPGAIERFEAALRMQRNHFWAQYMMAICHLKMQQFAEAKANLSACLTHQPDLVWLYILRGLANGELGEQRLGRQPREVVRNYATAYATVWLNDQPLAAIACSSYFRIAPPAWAQAEALFKNAEDDFRAAMEREPDEDAHYVLLVDRAAVRIRQARWHEAVADLREAIHLQPGQFLAYVNLAVASEKMGALDRAVAALDAAVERRPQAPLYRERSRLHLERHDYAPALRDIDMAIRLQPSPPGRDRLDTEIWQLAEDQVERGRLLYRMNRLDEALQACDAALALLPKFGKAHRLRAGVLMEQHRYKESARAFDDYLRHERGTADIYEARGLVKIKLHDYAGAIEEYTQGLALEPDLPLMHAHRGWAYLMGGDSPRLALLDFEQALKLKPGHADAYAGRGYARVRLGDYLKGVADAEVAVNQALTDARMHYNGARIYAQAVAKVEAEAKDRYHRELAQRYEARTLSLLRRALDLMPAGGRATFWHEQVQKDPALDPVRRRYGFIQLDAAQTTQTTP